MKRTAGQYVTGEPALRRQGAGPWQMLDRLAAYFAVLCPAGIVQDVNRTRLEAAGLEPGEVLGRSLEETPLWRDHEAARARLRDAVRRAAAGEEICYDEKLPGPGRRLTTVDFKIASVRDSRGRGTHLITSATDVEDRVQAQKALRRREARLKAVLDAAGLGAWHWNLRTGQVQLNARWVGMLGYRIDELEHTFSTFRALLHPEDWERVRSAVDEHFRGETDNYSVEIRMRHRDGHWVWVLSTGRLIERDRRGRPLVMTGTHQDISKRVLERQILQESEARFRNTFENAAVGIAHVGLDGRWLRMNTRLCEIVGWDRDELLSRSFQDITYPDDLQHDVGHFEAVLRGEVDSYRMEKRYVGRDGQITWASLTTSLQTDARGRPHYFISIVQDISEQKRAQEHRELLVNELNHRVKNTLSIVQSIAQQTFRSGRKAGRGDVAAFHNRLAALAAAHDLLTRTSWQWTSLEALVRETVKAGSGAHAPVDFAGPAVILAPKEAITFAMALHELLTNATKYGALSGAQGRIEIRWDVRGSGEDKHLRLVWRETGGPPVEAPACRGFGSRMIEEALAHELTGEVHMDFRPEGLVCTIEGNLRRKAA